jgi:amino acid transporter
MKTESTTGLENEPRSAPRSGLRANCLPFTDVLAQSIANIAPTVAPALTISLVFGIAGVGTWLTYLIATIGLVFVGSNINQFARRSASPGSLYAYITKGLGATTGVIAGWSLILAYLLTAMAVVCGFVNFIEVLLNPIGLNIAPIFLMAICTGVAWYFAYKDIQLSTALMLALEVGSIALILLLGVIILFEKGVLIDPVQLTLQGAQPSGVMFGLVLGVLSFVGFESATTLGHEARNPLRSIPKAVTLSTIVSGLFFVLMAYIEVIGFAGSPTPMTESSAPLNDLAKLAGVSFFGILISIGATVSMFACALACINAGSRILFTMGRHSIFHESIGRAHGHNETPHVAVTLSAVLIFLASASVNLFGVSILDGFAYFGTIATFGFLTVYILISIAAPVYLARCSELRISHIISSAIAIGLMLIPVLGSVGIPGSSVFPVPAAPYNVFPYLFLLYLVVGVAWFVILRLRSPNLIEAIESDIEASHAAFHER